MNLLLNCLMFLLICCNDIFMFIVKLIEIKIKVVVVNMVMFFMFCVNNIVNNSMNFIF